MGRRSDPRRDARIAELVTAGRTASQIAADVGMSTGGMTLALRRLQLTARPGRVAASSSRRPNRRRCDVGGCDNPHDARGYCKTHLRRLNLYGSPLGSASAEGTAHGGIWDAIAGGSAVWSCQACDYATLDYGVQAAGAVRRRGKAHRDSAHGRQEVAA